VGGVVGTTIMISFLTIIIIIIITNIMIVFGMSSRLDVVVVVGLSVRVVVVALFPRDI
jgi:hypothetical protein